MPSREPNKNHQSEHNNDCDYEGVLFPPAYGGFFQRKFVRPSEETFVGEGEFRHRSILLF